MSVEKPAFIKDVAGQFHKLGIRETAPAPTESELAWMLGVICGNGFIGKEYDRRIFLTRSNEPELLEEFRIIGQRLFGKESKAMSNRVGFFGRQVISDLGDLRNDAWPDTIRSKHEWILNDPKHTWKFIEGLFDTKGNIQTKPKDDNAIYFRTNNRPSADFIKNLLLSVGLKNPTIHSGKINKQIIYKVGVYNTADLKVIADSIRPKSTNKQKKLTAIKEIPDSLTDEKTIWRYALTNNLIPKILAQNLMSEDELSQIRNLLQRKVIRESPEELLDKFTMSVAKLAQ